jgi:hypothetical protein
MFKIYWRSDKNKVNSLKLHLEKLCHTKTVRDEQLK